MNNDKIMGIDHTLADIDKQIEELYAKKAEIERKEREQSEVERKKKEEEKEKELTAIKNAIEAFNEKHNEHYLIAKSIEIKVDDSPYFKYLPSDFVIEFDKTLSKYLESLLG